MEELCWEVGGNLAHSDTLVLAEKLETYGHELRLDTIGGFFECGKMDAFLRSHARPLLGGLAYAMMFAANKSHACTLVQN